MLRIAVENLGHAPEIIESEFEMASIEIARFDYINHMDK